MRTPYFPFYPGDYLADTLGLSCCQHGVYLLLLAISWQRGPLPDDMDHLSRLAANPPIEALRFILSEYWTLTEQGWINQRLEREREKTNAIFQRRSEAGKKAIAHRWGKKDESYPQSDTNRTSNVDQTYTIQNQNQNQKKKKTARKSQNFVPPTIEQVSDYARDRRSTVDPRRFIDFYESKGWIIGKVKMRDWKAAFRGWETRQAKEQPQRPQRQAW